LAKIDLTHATHQSSTHPITPADLVAPEVDRVKAEQLEQRRQPAGANLRDVHHRQVVATASQRSKSSSQAAVIVSSIAAGFLGAGLHGRANDWGSTPRWREPGLRIFSQKRR